MWVCLSYFRWYLRATFNSEISGKFETPWGFQNSKIEIRRYLKNKSTPPPFWTLSQNLPPHIFSEGYRRYLALGVTVYVSPKFFYSTAGTPRDVARLVLMAPIDAWQNSTPVFGAVAFCTTNIKDFRTSLTSTSSTIPSTYSSLKRSKTQITKGWGELCHTQD